MEVIQGLCLSLLCFLDNVRSIAVYDFNNLILKNIKHHINIFISVKVKIIQFFDWIYFSWLKFFMSLILIFLIWGFTERFLIIIKLGRWSVILFNKFRLKMVLSHMLTKMLSTTNRHYYNGLTIHVGLKIHNCKKEDDTVLINSFMWALNSCFSRS